MEGQLILVNVKQLAESIRAVPIVSQALQRQSSVSGASTTLHLEKGHRPQGYTCILIRILVHKVLP